MISQFDAAYEFGGNLFDGSLALMAKASVKLVRVVFMNTRVSCSASKL
jgi:hypothetical protein